MNISLSVLNLIDILLVTGIVFFTLNWIIKNSRALQIVKGAFFVITLKITSDYFDLGLTSGVLQSILIWGPLIFIILLQPEIRSGLETLADTSRFSLNRKDSDSSVRVISEIAFEFAREYTGALFVIENISNLSSFEESGIKLDAVVSKQLFRNIFDKQSNMHDGAALIRKDRIVSTSVILPLSGDNTMSLSYGTRHRSAIGISEISDAIVIVVSEERGEVSIVYKGQIEKVGNAILLRSAILDKFSDQRGVSDEQ